MELAAQVQFAEIYSNFLRNEHNLKDICNILTIIREYSDNLPYVSFKISNAALRKILEIPLAVLTTQTALTDEYAWAKENGDYFAGNCNSLLNFQDEFKTGKYTLSTIVDLLKTIMDYEDVTKYSYPLRNIEKTLADTDLKSTENFIASGILYAHILDEAFRL